MRINGHGHILPEPNEIPQFLKDRKLFSIDDDKKFMRQGDWTRPITDPSFFLREKLEWMERYKIDHAVMLNLSQIYCNGWERQETYDTIRWQNDFNAKIQREHPDKFTCGFVVQPLHLEDALKEIERLSEKSVRFMFFPNEYGVGHLSTERRLLQYFPTAVVARRTGYEAYLNLLNQNHLALSPFPFGNATSTIDCMVLGLPVISLIGAEPHSRSDYDILASLGLADYCVAESVENYVHGVVRYINEPGLLEELRNMVASKQFMDLHQQNENEFSDEMCKALNWAYANQNEVHGPRGLVIEAQGRWK